MTLFSSTIAIAERWTDEASSTLRLDILDDMPDSVLIMAYLRNNQPTRATRLFMDYCRTVELAAITPLVASA